MGDENRGVPISDPAAKGHGIDQYRNLANRLSQSGYPAELRIGRTLFNVGWEVEHAVYFRGDKVWREIDVLSRLSVRPQEDRGAGRLVLHQERFAQSSMEARPPGEVLQPTYVIECKQSKHEWVVFLPTAGLPPNAQLDAMPCFSPHGLGRDLVDFIDLVGQSAESGSLADEVDDLLGVLPFTPRDQIGHGIAAISDTQNSDNGKNRAYAAVESCVKAVQFFERQQVKELRDRPTSGGLPLTVAIYLPLVVLDGQLFTFSITGEGQELMRKVPMAAVHFRGGGSGSGIIVPIVTADALPEFSERARRVWSRIGEFATTPGAVPGEGASMVKLLVNLMRGQDSWGADGTPETQGPADPTT